MKPVCEIFTVDYVCYLLHLERFMRDFWAFTTKLILLNDFTRETLVFSACEGDLWGCLMGLFCLYYSNYLSPSGKDFRPKKPGKQIIS